MPYKSKEERLAYHRARYEREKEKLKGQALVRYYKNHEKRIEQMKMWQQEHPEEHRLNARLYHWEHRKEQLSKMKLRSARHYLENREQVIERTKLRALARYYRIKREVFDHYGSHCACCGEINPHLLTIDHVYNDGAAHRRELAGEKAEGRRSGDRIYGWLVKNNFPSGFQLLCYNCNCAKPKGACQPHRARPITEHWYFRGLDRAARRPPEGGER